MNEDVDVAETIKAVNPLLERLNKLPGTTIRLPSKGLFYLNGELDSECADGEILVYPMTLTDELLMKSIDMLFQGTAIDAVLKRCAPQILKPMDLLVPDIDYILTHLKLISYGKTLIVKHECDCIKDADKKKEIEAAGQNEYTVSIDSLIQTSKSLSSKDFNQRFIISLDNAQRVTMMPLRYRDYVKLQQTEDLSKLKDVKDIEDYVASNYSSITYSVDEIVDKDQIKEWYKELPIKHSRAIKKHLNKMEQWGIDFTHTVKCKFCKEDKELKTQLNPMYFFIMSSDQEIA